MNKFKLVVKIENLTELHDRFLKEMLKTNISLKQGTLLIIVESIKEEIINAHQVLHCIENVQFDLKISEIQLIQLVNYRNN